MNLRRVKHTLLRLTAEEKVIGIGSLLMIIGTFMPWYSVIMSFDKKNLIETGFSGDIGVIGFIIFLMSLISLLVLVGENMHLPLPQFGHKREQILLFFLGQSFFLTLLTMAIYTKRSLEFTEAGLGFGIYMVLTGAFFGSLSAFALIQKTKEKEVQEFFSHQNDEIKEAPAEAESKQMYFEEDVQTMEVIQETLESTTPDYIPEDDMIEDIQDIPRNDQDRTGKATKNSAEVNDDQKNYFTREAGINKGE